MNIDDSTEHSRKLTIIKYAVSVGIALVIALLAGLLENSFLEVKMPFIRLACDGCFVAGIMYLSFGGLSYVSVNGGFDALNYAFYMLKQRFLHPHPDHRDQDYYEFITNKRKNRKAHKVWYLLIIGGVFLLAAIIMVPFVPDVAL